MQDVPTEWHPLRSRRRCRPGVSSRECEVARAQIIVRLQARDELSEDAKNARTIHDLAVAFDNEGVMSPFFGTPQVRVATIRGIIRDLRNAGIVKRGPSGRFYLWRCPELASEIVLWNSSDVA